MSRKLSIRARTIVKTAHLLAILEDEVPRLEVQRIAISKRLQDQSRLLEATRKKMGDLLKTIRFRRGPKPGVERSNPRLLDAIQTVMRSKGKPMTAEEVHAELKKRRWLPNSDNPLAYVVYSLSANSKPGRKTNLFDRVERGVYKLPSKSKAKLALVG